MKKNIVNVLAFFLLAIGAANAEGIKFLHDWDEVLKKAESENKPIFVDVYASWCGPCKTLARTIFVLDEVGEYYNQNYICFKIDGDKERSHELVKKLQIRAYPTLAFLDSKGNVLYKQSGGTNKEGMLALGKKNYELFSKFPKAKAAYTKNPKDKEAVKQYSELLVLSGDQKEGERVTDEYLSSIKKGEMTEELSWYLTQNFLFDVSSKSFNKMIKVFPDFKKAHATDYKKYYSRLMAETIGKAVKDGKMDKINTLDKLNKKHSPDPSKCDKHSLFMKVKYYEGKNDRSNFLSNADAYINKYATSQEILGFVTNVIQKHKEDSEFKKATTWTKNLIEKEDNVLNNYYLAYLYYAQKDYKNAKIVVDKAISQDKGQYMRYLKGLQNDIINKKNINE